MSTSVCDNQQQQPTVIERAQHTVSRKLISESALKVLYRLKNHGHQAFLVGGAVRDLMLGGRPKDFDVATDAEPDEIRALFRNCRLIGRRFRLAHIRFGREIIEVATFRASRDPEQDTEQDSGQDSQLDDDHHQDHTGRILRDNVYGTISDDVWRRDFTVNALYYNIADFSIWDYVGGVADLEQHKMKLIGDPETRYREDPVRMLRAVRFAAKLDFSIDKSAEKPLKKLGELLHNVPPARLADEATKLFLSGHAEKSFNLLRKYKLFGLLYRQTERYLSTKHDGEKAKNALLLCQAATRNTDTRIAAEKSVTPAFLNAVFLWPVIEQCAQEHNSNGKAPIQSAILACDDVIAKQQTSMSIPRRMVLPIREILVMQFRLRYRRGVRAIRLVDHPRFRAAYDLLLLRAAVDQELEELAQWWTRFQTLDDHEKRRETGVGQRNSKKTSKKSNSKRRRRPRRKPAKS